MRHIRHLMEIKRKLKLLWLMILLSTNNIQIADAKIVGAVKPDIASCTQLYGYEVRFKIKRYIKERKKIFEYLNREYGKDAGEDDIFDLNLISIAKFDLNDDGKDEILCYWYNPGSCGSAGCSFMVFDSNFKLLEPFSHLHVREPILILKEKINSYHPFAFSTRWAYWNIWEWNGKEYDLANNILMVKDGCTNGSGYNVAFDINLSATEIDSILHHLNTKYSWLSIKKSEIRFYEYDLNDDGQKEILVYAPNAQFDVLDKGLRRDNIFVLSHDFKSITQLPNATARMIVLKEKVNSYHSLALYDRDLDYWRIWQWDGTKYNLTR